MTKQTALGIFKEECANKAKRGVVLTGQDKAEAWGNYTVRLYRDKFITGRQYFSWTNPF